MALTQGRNGGPIRCRECPVPPGKAGVMKSGTCGATSCGAGKDRVWMEKMPWVTILHASDRSQMQITVEERIQNDFGISRAPLCDCRQVSSHMHKNWVSQRKN